MGLWGGRFSEPSDADLRALNDSISFDIRMAQQDIRGSMAYARAICDVGILTPDERDQILAGLAEIAREFSENRFKLILGDEDIHTAVERRLVDLVGTAAKKLHTGRSRNDQVATDFRLWVIDAVGQIKEALRHFQESLVAQAEQHVETLMPGYTHLQPAQPITAAHWLMSFFWMVQRDQERLSDLRRRTSVMPLGSGALAGTPLAIDRAALAQELGFSSYSQNSLDSVSDRDFAAEFLFALALLGTHLSRLAEDVILYSNPAFGFITLNDRYSTGSSLMPQKRNADPMELARGKAGRLIGNLTGLLATLKGLPSSYNKDLQEDKEAVFDSFDTLQRLLPVVTAMVTTLRLQPERMQAALSTDMLATDLADYLVHKGMPFREAHEVIGRAVRQAEQERITLAELPLTTFQSLSSLFAEDVTSVFDFSASVARRSAIGGTAPAAVRQQISEAHRLLNDKI